MEHRLLEVNHLSAAAENREILKNVSFTIGQQETHVLLGPNGAGKSTLGNVLMGNPKYTVTGGNVLFDGENLIPLLVGERARKGLFMSFQNPVEVPGLKLSAFLHTALENQTGRHIKNKEFKQELSSAMETVRMDASYAGRDVNAGFSGGEKKKSEILQMVMLKPKLAILDETDSGLDIDAVRAVSEGIRAFGENSPTGFLIITHTARILEGLSVNRVHIMVEGSLVYSGGAELIEQIDREGYAAFEEMRRAAHA